MERASKQRPCCTRVFRNSVYVRNGQVFGRARVRHCGDDEAGAVVDGNAVDPCDADANALISVEELINVVLDAEAVGGDNRVTVGFCGSDFDVIEEPIEDDEAAGFEVRWGRVIPSRSACVISLHRLTISCIGKGSLCMVVLLYNHDPPVILCLASTCRSLRPCMRL